VIKIEFLFFLNTITMNKQPQGAIRPNESKIDQLLKTSLSILHNNKSNIFLRDDEIKRLKSKIKKLEKKNNELKSNLTTVSLQLTFTVSQLRDTVCNDNTQTLEWNHTEKKWYPTFTKEDKKYFKNLQTALFE
jgi:hypothetical protein